MPEAASAGAVAGSAGQKKSEGGSSFLRTAVQSIGIFIFVQFAIKQLLPQQAKSTSTTTTTTAEDGAAVTNTVTVSSSIPRYEDRPSLRDIEGEYNPMPQWIAPMWDVGTSLDLAIYISPSLVVPPFRSMPAGALVVEEKDFVIGNYKDSRDIHATFQVPREVQHNATLWGHFFVAQSGAALDPSASNYDQSTAYHFARPLNQFLPKKKAKKTRNLLASKEEQAAAEETSADTGKVITSHYHGNFTLSFIPDSGVSSYPQMHPAIREHLELESMGARDETGHNSWYYPIAYLNTFWQLRTHMSEINDTVTTLPLNIHLNNLANWKFAMVTSLDYGVKQNQQKAAQGQTLPGGGDGSEFEEIKRILLDSNSYLLATTVVVGILHTIFEMLAFKNDVSHWRNKKDNVGVSFRTILANVFMQTTIFLYLMDNTENTSWMILLGQGMSILIEAWKITKTVNVRMRPTPPDSTDFPWRFLPYTVVFEDKHQLSETEKKTQEYDQIAFTYLYYVAIPLLLAYAVYSLIYESHKSWYSFVLTTLVGSVYAYGFLMMVPSLYINYRLKSVAHMPAKAMTYKFLNTFIDDLFAFTIKMPTLHRLATLRDDVIFFVYLYQSYKYKIDFARVNEFGQGGDEEGVVAKLAAAPLKAPAEGAGATATTAKAIEEIKSESVATGTNATDGSTKKRK